MTSYVFVDGLDVSMGLSKEFCLVCGADIYTLDMHGLRAEDDGRQVRLEVFCRDQ